MVEITKEIKQKNCPIVRNIAVSDTLREIKPGQEVLYEAKEFAPFTTALITARRLYSQGEGEWEVTPVENGSSYIIKRKH